MKNFTTREQPRQVDWICLDCGSTYGRHLPGLATWHTDRCDLCGKKTPCTQPRDFGYLEVQA